MSKNRLILSVLGGVIGLIALVMAYFIWSAYSAKTAAIEGDEESEGLESCVDKAERLSRGAVYPCAESVKAVEANIAKVGEWKSDASRLAARGDRVFPKTTPAAFKTFIVADAKRLSSLPGLANGALMKPDFAFGPFKDYISGGNMPADDKLAELQRRWDDVTTVIETLAACGIAELVEIDFKTLQAKEDPKEAEAKKNNRGKNRKSNAGRKAKAEASEPEGPAAYTYGFTFTTRPAGFVKAINALETGERFTVVNDFSFVRAKDVIADALGGDEKKEAQQASSRRSRRGRRAAAQPEAEKEGPKNGIVTDPVLDEPFTVSMTVTVYDFRTLEESADQDKKGSTK